jgi:predicted peroxiredoxin
MASELFIGLHGSEDPTKATFPFLMANGALDAGYETAIILIGDAVVLMNSTVADNVQDICGQSSYLYMRGLCPRSRDNRQGLGRQERQVCHAVRGSKDDRPV